MRDRNIFDQLPIEEISEDTIPLSNSIESDSKRNSNFRRRTKKIKAKTTECNDAALDYIVIKELNKLSIDSIEPEEESYMDSDKVKKKPRRKDLNSVENKNVNGAKNWQVFLQTTTPTSQELRDAELFLSNDYKDDMSARKKLGCLAMDCEMVGTGEDKRGNMLARVSIVNALGECVYDTFVKPTMTITDYRTAVSGVRSDDLVTAPDFQVVRKKVLETIRGRILVGHAIHNDLIVLDIRHPWYLTRDTSRYKRFYEIGFGTPSLKRLTSVFLNVEIQTGEHNSIQDAQATMQLYMLFRREWEAEIKRHRALRLRYHAVRRPNSSNKSKRKRRK